MSRTSTSKSSTPPRLSSSDRERHRASKETRLRHTVPASACSLTTLLLLVRPLRFRRTTSKTDPISVCLTCAFVRPLTFGRVQGEREEWAEVGFGAPPVGLGHVLAISRRATLVTSLGVFSATDAPSSRLARAPIAGRSVRIVRR